MPNEIRPMTLPESLRFSLAKGGPIGEASADSLKYAGENKASLASQLVAALATAGESIPLQMAGQGAFAGAGKMATNAIDKNPLDTDLASTSIGAAATPLLSSAVKTLIGEAPFEKVLASNLSPQVYNGILKPNSKELQEFQHYSPEIVTDPTVDKTEHSWTGGGQFHTVKPEHQDYANFMGKRKFAINYTDTGTQEIQLPNGEKATVSSPTRNTYVADRDQELFPSNINGIEKYKELFADYPDQDLVKKITGVMENAKDMTENWPNHEGFRSYEAANPISLMAEQQWKDEGSQIKLNVINDLKQQSPNGRLSQNVTENAIKKAGDDFTHQKRTELNEFLKSKGIDYKENIVNRGRHNTNAVEQAWFDPSKLQFVTADGPVDSGIYPTKYISPEQNADKMNLLNKPNELLNKILSKLQGK